MLWSQNVCWLNNSPLSYCLWLNLNSPQISELYLGLLWWVAVICDVSSVQKFSCFGQGIQVSGLTLTEFCLCEVTVYSRRLLQAFVVCMGMILMKISFWSQQYRILYMIYTLIYQDTLVICTMSHCNQEYTSREYKTRAHAASASRPQE